MTRSGGEFGEAMDKMESAQAKERVSAGLRQTINRLQELLDLCVREVSICVLSGLSPVIVIKWFLCRHLLLASFPVPQSLFGSRSTSSPEDGTKSSLLLVCFYP